MRQRGLQNLSNNGHDASAGTLYVVGSANIDSSVLVDQIPEPGETVIASEPQLGLGGKGANQAVAARAAGAEVSFIARLGGDPEAAWIRKELGKHGIAIEHIPNDPQLASGRAYIAVDRRGENSIFVSPGSNMHFRPDEASRIMRKVANGATLVLAQAEIPTATIDAIAHGADKYDVRFVLNLAPFARVSLDTLSVANPLIVNVVEAEGTLDHLYAGKRHLIQSLKSAKNAAELLSKTSRSAIVTLGSGGCVVCENGVVTHIPAEKVESVVDTTGAGDAFVGAVAANLMVADDLKVAASHGNMASARTIGLRGATNILAEDGSMTFELSALTGTES